MNNTIVILPAYKEVENLRVLVPEILKYDVDVLVVDDSPDDDTLDLSNELGFACIKRHDKKGLSSAVVTGIKQTKHSNVIVMDADRQHPPETIPHIIEALKRSELVIASRNVEGGGYAGFTPKRRLISVVANLLALPIIPKIKDRMTGFFAFRRVILNETELHSDGFKIGLEIFARGNYVTYEEVPFVFLPRVEGESKLTNKVMLAYVRQLIPLYLRTRIFRFACVGASGTVVGLGTLYGLTEWAGLYYLLSYVAAFILSVTNNYIWNSLWTFRHHSGLTGWTKYAIISAITLTINTALVYALTEWVGLWYMLSAVVGILTAFALNFTFSRRFVWRK